MCGIAAPKSLRAGGLIGLVASSIAGGHAKAASPTVPSPSSPGGVQAVMDPATARRVPTPRSVDPVSPVETLGGAGFVATPRSPDGVSLVGGSQRRPYRQVR